jgi:AcrR family transcriptional regulator|tara:strand:+ start:2425 stop:3081 length:657 start_codon:yes stop_codon:yes gene_type:complete
MNTRQQSKAKRRDAILDAAITLLGVRDSHNVTTDEIADVAGVAPATVYNLIGTRDDLVHAIVARVLEDLAESLTALAADEPPDPIAAAFLVVDQTVHAFTTHSAAFRRIVALAQSTARAERIHDPSNLQVKAMQAAQSMCIIRDDVDAAALGRQIFVSYSGALSLWSNDRLDDDGFSTVARHGLLTALAAAATDDHRDRFLTEMYTTGQRLEQISWRT